VTGPAWPRMRLRASWLLLVLAVPLLAGCVAEADFAPVPSAGWRPGYTFEHSVESRTEVSGFVRVDGTEDDEEFEPRSETFGPERLVTYTVFDVEARNGDEPVYLTVADPGSLEASVHARSDLPDARARQPLIAPFRQSDLQPLRAGMGYNSRDGKVVEARLDYAEDDTYAALRFPLRRGDAWTTVDERGATGFFGGTATVESQVGGLRKVPGPDGEVDAVHVAHVMAGGEAFAEYLRAEIEGEGGQVDRLEFQAEWRRDVDYAPSLHNIVRDVTTMDGRLVLEATIDGKRTSVDIAESSTVAITLTGALLQETAPRTLEDAIGGLVPVLPIVAPLPTTGPPPPAGPAIEVMPATATVNVAADGKVGFTTRVQGEVSGLGHRIANAATGEEVVRGDGGTFAHTFTDAGRYAVTVTGRTVDGQQVEGKAHVSADFQALTDATCGTAAVQGVSACPPTPVPVRAGVAKVTVAVERHAAAGEPGVGKLVLTAPDGRTFSADLSANKASLTLDQGLDPGEWSLEYRPTVGLQESVTYAVHVAA
jgi:hypothetical protein